MSLTEGCCDCWCFLHGVHIVALLIFEASAREMRSKESSAASFFPIAALSAVATFFFSAGELRLGRLADTEAR